MADPYFKFFAADYLLDERVDALDLEAQAILVRLWCLAWRDGGLTPDPAVLARRAMVDQKAMKRHWDALVSFFEVGEDGLLYSNRMEVERKASNRQTNSRKRGAEITNAKRWGKQSLTESLDVVAQRSLSDTHTETHGESMSGRISESEEKKENYPPTPSAVAAGETKARNPRKKPMETDDCAPAVLPHAQAAYRFAPQAHPVTGEPVHKGSFAQAARAIQRIVDSGVEPADLEWVSRIYYAAEDLETQHPEAFEGLTSAVSRAWDTRPKAMMHVATLFGPEKKPYAQLLNLARKARARFESMAPAVLPLIPAVNA